MKDLTLIIPSKRESESLPIFLKELKKYKCKKKIVLQKDDTKTINSLKHRILNKGKNEFILTIRFKHFCLFVTRIAIVITIN